MGSSASRIIERRDAFPEEGAAEQAATADLSLDSLEAARSVVDKFLVEALLDSALRGLYVDCGSVGSVQRLKRRLVEAVLCAARGGVDFGVPKPALRLQQQIHDDVDVSKELRACLKAAVEEHLVVNGATTITSFLESPKEAQKAAKILREWEAADKALLLRCLPTDAELTSPEKLEKDMARREDERQTQVGPLKLTPLSVPLYRRRQTFSCLIFALLLPGSILINCIFLWYWKYTWYFLVPYYVYVAMDRKPWTGGQQVLDSWRRFSLWKQCAGYFPVTLIRANLNKECFTPDKPYLFGYHPHGVLATGAALAFGSEACGWSERFPGLTPRLCTLNLTVSIPIFRELIAPMGVIPASERAVAAALRPGNAVVLVVGGAAEALDASCGKYVLTLRRRRGFFRLALQRGATLVPTFGFGENDIFDFVQLTSRQRQLQDAFKNITGFTMPLFHGRGVFSYNYGMLPHRRPVTVVVGEPIDIKESPNPTKEDIDSLREKYINSLTALFEEYKPRLAEKNAELIII